MIVGQDGILRAGCQPAMDGPFCTRRQAGYQPAAGCQPAPQAGAIPKDKLKHVLLVLIQLAVRVSRAFLIRFRARRDKPGLPDSTSVRADL
jgi:hypothetical protein